MNVTVKSPQIRPEVSDHQGVTPSPEAVRDELHRILTSEPFANAARLSRLLRYLVDRTLAGEGDQLKEYVLGVEVFDRGEQYDPRLDSIVRVEARRLRAKLDEYYANAGAHDPLVISVPRGSYAALFETSAPGFETSGVPQVAPSPVSEFPGSTVRRVALLASLAAAVAVMIVSVAWRSGASNATRPSVVVAVLPFENYLTDPQDNRLAARLTDSVTAELARLGSVGVVSRTSALQFEGARKPLREIAQALNANVVMEGSVTRDGDRIRVTTRLVDAGTDRKIWVEDYYTPAREIGTLPARIAEGAAQAAITRRARP